VVVGRKEERREEAGMGRAGQKEKGGGVKRKMDKDREKFFKSHEL
jgi:hypothetical protein